MPSVEGFPGLDVAVPLRKPPKYEVMLPQIAEMAEAGSGIDLISRALGIGAEVVRDALHLHRTGKRSPGRVDGRRRPPRQPGQPFVPKYQKMAAEVDRRRKAGESFDRLALEMKVSRNTVDLMAGGAQSPAISAMPTPLHLLRGYFFELPALESRGPCPSGLMSASGLGTFPVRIS